ncbi:MAG TPA: MurR/RpiR family transcriptional regulator [Kiloniellales bacterium]
MQSSDSFDDRLNICLDAIRPAERRVAQFFQANREEVLIASASALARQTGTSDATVIRTAKALGFAGMEDLRRTLAQELRGNLTPAGRMARTLRSVGDDLESALSMTLNIHQESLEALGRDITPRIFRTAVRLILAARRVIIFGIGPSSAMAEYFTIQLGRFGIDAQSLTQTGLLLADGVHRLVKGDLVVVFAYGRVYRELAVLLDQADRRRVAKILLSDTLGPKLRDRVDVVLPVARGRADMLSMHTATLALIEALLVGVATKRPKETIASLNDLNGIRAALAGKPMDLPSTQAGS